MSKAASSGCRKSCQSVELRASGGNGLKADYSHAKPIAFPSFQRLSGWQQEVVADCHFCQIGRRRYEKNVDGPNGFAIMGCDLRGAARTILDAM